MKQLTQKQPLTPISYVAYAKELMTHVVGEDKVSPEVTAQIFDGDKYSLMFVAFMLGKGFTRQELLIAEQEFVIDNVSFIEKYWKDETISLEGTTNE